MNENNLEITPITAVIPTELEEEFLQQIKAINIKMLKACNDAIQAMENDDTKAFINAQDRLIAYGTEKINCVLKYSVQENKH